MKTLRRLLRRRFRGLWLSPDFRKLWGSLTITAFGAQVTNLALPLTAALLLHATPMQMGVLVALETLPFALVSLHAGVLLDRVRKLPIVILADLTRGAALLAIPIAAWMGALSIDVLFVVGFFCGLQNVVGGAAYQVLLAQLAGRKRLVEANAKISLGETSSALIGPGLAGGLIQLLTAPFAIVLDAFGFFISALMLRRVRADGRALPSLPVGPTMATVARLSTDGRLLVLVPPGGARARSMRLPGGGHGPDLPTASLANAFAVVDGLLLVGSETPDAGRALRAIALDGGAVRWTHPLYTPAPPPAPPPPSP